MASSINWFVVQHKIDDFSASADSAHTTVVSSAQYLNLVVAFRGMGLSKLVLGV